VTPVISAYRTPRYVLPKVLDGVSSDWQWYTQIAALRRAAMLPDEWGPLLRARVVRVAGHPADYGAPAPDRDILRAGVSLCQNYLEQVRAGAITCRPAIATVNGQTVTFTDGSRESVDAIVCATGYQVDLPYLAAEIRAVLGDDLRLHLRTLHPDLPGLGFLGQFALQGPYFPLLELQARWIVGIWSGQIPPAAEDAMRAAIAVSPPALDSHNMLAVALAEAAGVAPDLRSRPELAEALLFGPMLPSRYRLDGPGACADAAQWFAADLKRSPRPAVDAGDIAALAALGLADVLTL
jgi:hypothetical protein